MKKTFYALVCILTVAALTMTGCKKDEENNNSNGGNNNTTTDTTTHGGGGGQTTTFNEWTIGADSMAVANGTGTLTMNGQTYNIVVAHLSEVNAGGGIHSSLQMYDSYKPSLYLQGDFAITIQLDQTLETGTYTSDGTNVSVNHKDVGSYFLPQGTTYSVTRTGNIVSVSIEATNVTGNDIHGQPTTTTDISFNYSGSVYYLSYGI